MHLVHSSVMVILFVCMPVTLVYSVRHFSVGRSAEMQQADDCRYQHYSISTVPLPWARGQFFAPCLVIGPMSCGLGLVTQKSFKHIRRKHAMEWNINWTLFCQKSAKCGHHLGLLPSLTSPPNLLFAGLTVSEMEMFFQATYVQFSV